MAGVAVLAIFKHADDENMDILDTGFAACVGITSLIFAAKGNVCADFNGGVQRSVRIIFMGDSITGGEKITYLGMAHCQWQ